MIRRGTPADIAAAVEIAVESVSRNPLPVRISRDAITEMVEQCVRNNAHFAMVSEVDGKVVAAMGAMVQQGFWFERLQCDVVLYYTRVPGEGVKLMREFARWVKSRPAIKMANFSLEPDADPRLKRFLRRLGFAMEFPQMTYVRGKDE